MNRRRFSALVSASLAWAMSGAWAGAAEGQPGIHGVKGGRGLGSRPAGELPAQVAASSALSLVLGRVAARSAAISALAREAGEGFFEYGTAPGRYSQRTAPVMLLAGQPVESELSHLEADTQYFYRLQWRAPGQGAFSPRAEAGFHTQRGPGRPFTFCVQGDSHPERPQMHDPALYARTLLQAAAAQPDFYFCMGDDFSVDTLHERTEQTVAARYVLQRPFLGLVAQSAGLCLVNGNHEQASLFNFNQPGQLHDVAVWAQKARNRYYPLPGADGFYRADPQCLPGIGPLRDYYAWSWGDALFVVLDCYWQSPACVDSPLRDRDGALGQPARGGHSNRDWWGMTLGEAQYRWFQQTLEQSQAKFKFVFAHHVLGTGRGGVEEAGLFEWGGRNRRGAWEFGQHRPGWELPIHQLMVRHGVTIFFQGHDHLFARQERDGVIYQEVPNPADPGYVACNAERYLSGQKLPNSGHLRVSVSSEQVRVEYVRSFLAQDETATRKSGEVACSYTLQAKGA